MRNTYLVIFFLLVLVIHIYGIYIGNESIEQLTKPLLLVTLIVYFLLATNSYSPGLKKWIVGALIFSLTGDVLLMFVTSDASFFLAGLVAFLIAHLFYIFFFHSIRIFEKIKGKVFLLLLVFIYYAALITFLNPWLNDMKLPVRIYSVVICFMLMLSMHMFYIHNRKAGWKMFLGALLFVLSDSVLAINKFYISFIEAGPIIMLTYGLAQLFLVQGAIEYIRKLK
jgi:uncharacterized membrane protein YhhN